MKNLAGRDRGKLQFDLRGLSEFERAVLMKALEIPGGEVRPYSWIAREIGHPEAVRAVGAAEGAAHDPWFNQTLTTVNDCAVRLAVIDGRLVDWHKHEHEDEFFLVLEGRLELEVEGREPFVLGPRQGVTIPRGIVHRPHALGRTVVLMVEPATVVPTGND